MRLLAEARRRGMNFEAAWDEVVRPRGRTFFTTSSDVPELALRWSTDQQTRKADRDAILATKEGWRRCYDREPPTRADVALTVLPGLLGELAPGEVPPRVFQHAA